MSLRVHHGGGSLTGFVGEHGTGDAGLNSQRGCCTCEAADCRCSGKCRFYDQRHRGRNLSNVYQNNAQCCQNEENDHKGNDLACKFHNAFSATKDDHPDDQAVAHAEGDQGQIKCRAEAFRNGISLNTGKPVAGEADAEDGCQNERQFHALGKQLPKTLGDVIGRAAIRLTIFVIASVVACQRNLGTLQRHTEQSGDPQPEQSAGAANGNRCCYAADITDADCAANGSSGCLECTDVSGTLLILGLVK